MFTLNRVSLTTIGIISGLALGACASPVDESSSAQTEETSTEGKTDTEASSIVIGGAGVAAVPVALPVAGGLGVVPVTAGIVPVTAGIVPVTAGVVPVTAGIVPVTTGIGFGTTGIGFGATGMTTGFVTGTGFGATTVTGTGIGLGAFGGCVGAFGCGVPLL